MKYKRFKGVRVQTTLMIVIDYNYASVFTSKILEYTIHSTPVPSHNIIVKR
jgi:hypothetical protein